MKNRNQDASWRGTVSLALLCLALSGCQHEADVSGRWQLSWEGRIGTERATVILRQHADQLSGEYQSARGRAPLSGSIRAHAVSFKVAFAGPPAYQISFEGTLTGRQLSGQAQAHDADARAYAGHGGEISSQFYRWNAQRDEQVASTAGPATH